MEPLRIKVYERDPLRKIEAQDKPNPNPYFLTTLTDAWTDEVDTADRRRDEAKKRVKQYAGGREPSVNHAKDGGGDYFVCVVVKRVDEVTLRAAGR